MENNIENRVKEEVAVILLLVNNEAFKTKQKSYDLELSGKTMREWIKFALGDAEIKEVEATKNDDVITLVKQHLPNKKYTFVFYSDTPLLTRRTFLEIFEYMSVKQLSTLKLTRGYVFDTEYLKTVDKIYNPQIAYFNEEDFMAAYNLKQLAMIGDILKGRILSYHLKQGVRIIDTATTYIDAEVDIEENVVIYPNNSIKGKSYIEKGVTLYENNIIKNSYILEKASVSSSYVFDSVIGKNCGVGPFSFIQDESVLEKDAQVGAFVEFRKGKLEEAARVRRLSFVGKEDLD